MLPTPPAGLPEVPDVHADLIAFNLLSMAVILQSTSVAMRRAYSRFTNCDLLNYGNMYGNTVYYAKTEFMQVI